MSNFISISIVKQNKIPSKQFISSLNNLPQYSLREYLTHSGIYNATRKRSKFDLIEMIVYGRFTNSIKIIDGNINKDDAIKY